MSPGLLTSDVPASNRDLFQGTPLGYGASKNSKKYPSPSQKYFPFKVQVHLNKGQLLS